MRPSTIATMLASVLFSFVAADSYEVSSLSGPAPVSGIHARAGALFARQNVQYCANGKYCTNSICCGDLNCMPADAQCCTDGTYCLSGGTCIIQGNTMRCQRSDGQFGDSGSDNATPSSVTAPVPGATVTAKPASGGERLNGGLAGAFAVALGAALL